MKWMLAVVLSAVLGWGVGATPVLADGESAIVGAALAAASGDDRTPAQPAPDQMPGKPGAAPGQIPAGWAVHTNRDAGFSLAIPGDWQIFDLRELAEMPELGELESSLLEAFAELIPFVAGDPTGTTSASVIALPVPAGASLADLEANAGEVIEQLNALGVETTVQSVMLPAGRALALEYKIQATPRTPAATIRQYFFVEKNTLFILTLGSINATPAADEQLRRIANSFRIL